MTMNDCVDGAMRDLLPDYVQGTLPGVTLSRVEAHVGACRDCAAEVALLRAIQAAFPTPPVDVRRIVAALPAPSARAARRQSVVASRWRFAAAATVIAVAGLSLAVLRGTFIRAGDQKAALAVRGVVLPASPAATPGAALVPVAHPAGAAAGLTFDGGLSDLTDQQLQTLLREIDALDAKPNAEPESNVGHIVPVREGAMNEN